MADANLVKICRKCNKELAVDEFEPSKRSKDGRINTCRDCRTFARFGRARTPPVVRYRVVDGAPFRTCAECNEEKPATLGFFYRSSRAKFGVATICRACAPTYVIECRKVTDPGNERLNETATAWRKANRDRHNEAAKRARDNRTEERRAAHRAWLRKYQRKRRASDPQYRLLASVRTQINMVVRSKFDGKGLLRRLGYSRNELIAHIERQFDVGMSWANYGKNGRGRVWELDHIRPCASFDLAKDDEFQACWSLSNLRPMWAVDNRSKGARLETLV